MSDKVAEARAKVRDVSDKAASAVNETARRVEERKLLENFELPEEVPPPTSPRALSIYMYSAGSVPWG